MGILIMWAKLRQQMWQWRGVLIAAPSVTGLLIGLRVAGWLQGLELAALDQFFRLRPKEPVDSRIVIVEINETDVQKAGQWPMSDATLAKLLETLKQQQPRAIGLDIYRDLPVEPGHRELVKVLNRPRISLAFRRW
jgi:adenylate cyclase